MIGRIYYRIIRKLLGVPPPVITREEAIRIGVRALQRSDAAGGTDLTIDMRYILIYERLRTWSVGEDWRIRNCPWVVIDNQTGAVLRIWVLPR